ncbi:MAG: helix-turn-helix transcriptional regulator [Saprospiraceae bacterium]|nr:helix-turn-helix transcriptional regulator [Saprospiraceae bacterium]
MIYQKHLPPPHLQDYVRFFWFLESSAKTQIPYVYRSMADGCLELVFHYKGHFTEITNGLNIAQVDSLIHAQSDQFRRFITDEHFGIFGAYIYPYAAQRLFGHPATVLSNHMLGLSDLLGQAGSMVEEQMMLASDNKERVEILTQFLTARARGDFKIKNIPAVNVIKSIIHERGIATVKELADQSYLSVRQFERKFKQFSGFSPKLYTRIIRFQAAMDAYGKPKRSLTEIAYEAGYYDQSHFIHEFKRFSGYHPKAFFSGRAEGTEYRDEA